MQITPGTGGQSLMLSLPPDVMAGIAATLEEYAQTGNLTAALANNGVSYYQHANLMRGDPEYVRQYEQAREYAVQRLEAHVYARAIDGSEEASKTWLRGNCPERYGTATVKQETSGQLDVVVTFEEPTWNTPETAQQRRALPPA